MPVCVDDGYPLVPVRETGADGMIWACSNPWHPRTPGACPACGHTGRPRSPAPGMSTVARCARCRHEWLPA